MKKSLTWPYLGEDGKTMQYPEMYCKYRNWAENLPEIDCDCMWVAPYGFVPESDCLKHEKTNQNKTD